MKIIDKPKARLNIVEPKTRSRITTAQIKSGLGATIISKEEIVRRKFLNKILLNITPLIQEGHNIGAHIEAKHLKRAIDKCGWELATWLDNHKKHNNAN